MRIVAGVAAVLAIVLAGVFARTVEPPPDIGVSRTTVAAPETPVAANRAGMRLRPVDPVTLADRTDLPGLRIAGGGRPFASADGRLIAIVSEFGGQITIVDAARLEQLATFELRDPGDAFVLRDDGLLWIEEGERLVIHPIAGDRREVMLPPGFGPWAVEPLPGERAAVVGHDGIGARVAVVDLTREQVVSEVTVEGVPPSEGEFSPNVPALVSDPARQRLYVAFLDRVAVVDLAAGEVIATVDLTPTAGAPPWWPPGWRGSVRTDRACTSAAASFSATRTPRCRCACWTRTGSPRSVHPTRRPASSS